LADGAIYIMKNLIRNWQFDMAICIDRAGKRSTSGSTFVQALCKSLEDKNINEFGDLQRAMMNHLSKNDAMPPIFINSLRKRINL